jgi:predicted nucleic acid-binding protein
VAEIVIDTSAWIDYSKASAAENLQAALDEGLVSLPPLVVAEVISGASTIEQRNAIGEFLQEAVVHKTPLGHWIDVGLLRRQLRRKGLTVTLPDAHVAQCALDLDAFCSSRARDLRRDRASHPAESHFRSILNAWFHEPLFTPHRTHVMHIGSR